MAVSGNIAKLLLVGVLIVAVVNNCEARCSRHAKNVPRHSKKSGDGGYRIYIDGQPERYQPGKIYNGRFRNEGKIKTIEIWPIVGGKKIQENHVQHEIINKKS